MGARTAESARLFPFKLCQLNGRARGLSGPRSQKCSMLRGGQAVPWPSVELLPVSLIPLAVGGS